MATKCQNATATATAAAMQSKRFLSMMSITWVEGEEQRTPSNGIIILQGEVRNRSFHLNVISVAQ